MLCRKSDLMSKETLWALFIHIFSLNQEVRFARKSRNQPFKGSFFFLKWNFRTPYNVRTSKPRTLGFYCLDISVASNPFSFLSLPFARQCAAILKEIFEKQRVNWGNGCRVGGKKNSDMKFQNPETQIK